MYFLFSPKYWIALNTLHLINSQDNILKCVNTQLYLWQLACGAFFICRFELCPVTKQKIIKNVQNGRQIQDGRKNVRCHVYFFTFDIIDYKILCYTSFSTYLCTLITSEWFFLHFNVSFDIITLQWCYQHNEKNPSCTFPLYSRPYTWLCTCKYVSINLYIIWMFTELSSTGDRKYFVVMGGVRILSHNRANVTITQC